MHFSRFALATTALLLNACGSAPVPSKVPAAEAWAFRFAQIQHDPGARASACAPKIMAGLSSWSDRAAAQKALREATPCFEQVRTDYQSIDQQLNAMPAPPEDLARNVGARSPAQIIAEQRRITASSTRWLDAVERVITFGAAGNVSMAQASLPIVRANSGAMMDQAILIMRVNQAGFPDKFPRPLTELSVLYNEAFKTLVTTTPTGEGLRVGRDMQAIAARATKLVAELPASHAANKLRPDASSCLDRVRIEGSRLATILNQAGRTTVLPADQGSVVISDLIKVDTTLHAIERQCPTLNVKS